MVGTFAWYGKEVDPTMAETLSPIALGQSTATENLEREVNIFWTIVSLTQMQE